MDAIPGYCRNFEEEFNVIWKSSMLLSKTFLDETNAWNGF